jgi:UDP-glucuronate 4-epimerase
MNILVTGSAGFIGMHVSMKLLSLKHNVFGLDNFNNYYDVNLKEDRIQNIIRQYPKFSYERFSLSNKIMLKNLFDKHEFDIVVNLAAQAGVRYSIKNPDEFINSNIVGFNNLLQCCVNNNVKHLVYASSSSIYGINEKLPFAENDNASHPLSLYGATKRSNELMAHAYSSLYKLPITGLRFFTVYGPFGRPDMALFLFTKAILNKQPIKLFNNGNMVRDFTYIGDIVEGIKRIIFKIPKEDHNFDKFNPSTSESSSPYKILNIGNGKPEKLLNYVSAIENSLGIKAIKVMSANQPGDVKKTHADTTKLKEWIDFKPNITIDVGVEKFISWYLKYYKITK